MNRLILTLSTALFLQILSAASVAAQAPTVITVLPRMRMTRDWRDTSGVLRPGILRDGRHLSIDEFRTAPTVIIDGMTITNADAVRRICSVPRRARTVIIDNVSVITRCPANARLWQLIPGRMVTLPPANAQPPPPLQRETSSAEEQEAEGERRRRAEAEEANERLQRELNTLQTRYDQQSTELAGLRDQMREGVRRAAVNAEVLRLNGELDTANGNVRDLTTKLAKAGQDHSAELSRRQAETDTERQRVESEHQQTIERLRQSDDEPWPWWYFVILIVSVTAVIEATIFVVKLIIDRRRLRLERDQLKLELEAVENSPPAKNIGATIALTALQQRMREQDRDHREFLEILRDLPGYNPDALPEENRRVLTNLKLLANQVTRGPGYKSGVSLTTNLETMLADLTVAKNILRQHPSYRGEKSLLENLEEILKPTPVASGDPPRIPAPMVQYYKDPDDENVLAEAEGRQRGTEFKLSESDDRVQRLENALTVQGREISRLTTDANAAKEVAKDLDASLAAKGESHGRLDLKNASLSIEDLIRQVVAMFDSVRKERDLVRGDVTALETKLLQTQTESANNSALLERLLELVLSEEPKLAHLGVQVKDLEAIISGMLDELQFHRSETEFRVSNPASHTDNAPLASPPPSEPEPDSVPSPDGVQTTVMKTAEHEALRAASAEPARDSVSPTPLKSEGTKPKIKASRLPRPVTTTSSGFPGPLAVQTPPADDASEDATTLRRANKETPKNLPPPPPPTNGGTNGKPFRMDGDEKPVTGKTMRPGPVALVPPIVAPAMPPPIPPDARVAARELRRRQPPPEGSGSFVIDASGALTPASQIPPPPVTVNDTGKIQTLPPDAVQDVRDPNAPHQKPDLQKSYALVGSAISQGIGGMDSTRPPSSPGNTDDTDDTIRVRRPTFPPAAQ